MPLANSREENEQILNNYRENGRRQSMVLSDVIYLGIVERLLISLSESDFKNQVVIGSQVKKVVMREDTRFRQRLRLYYCGDPRIEGLSQRMPMQLFENEKIPCDYHIKEEQSALVAECIYWVGEYQFPIQFEIKYLPMMGQRVRMVNVPLTGKRMKSISVYEFLPEILLEENYLYFLEYMELSGEMRCFADIYNILTKESVNGRLVCSLLCQRLKEKNLELSDAKRALIMGYHKNPFLRKKWNAYRKREGISKPYWKDIMDVALCFLDGIWDCLVNNDIFMGDWMPQIKRFL